MYKEAVAMAMAVRLVELAGSLPHKKLMKLLYLTERSWLFKKGMTMCGDLLMSLPEGPILSKTYDAMKVTGRQGPMKQSLTPIDGSEIRKIADVEYRQFLTPAQIATIDEVWEKFGGMSQDDIIEYTHTLPEWFIPEGKNTNPISYKAIAADEEVGLDVTEQRTLVLRALDSDRVDQCFTG